MAVFNASASAYGVQMQSQSLEQFNYWLLDLFKGDTTVGYHGATQFTDVDLLTQARAVVRGTGLTYGDLQSDGSSVWAQPLTGTITSLTIYSPTGELVYKLSGLSFDVATTPQSTNLFEVFLKGNDKVDGGEGNDLLQGYTGNDTINGGAGNDTLVGGSGADQLDGGEGIDTASYAEQTDALSVSFAATGASNLTIKGVVDTLANIENVVGGAGNDTITGHGTTAVDNYFDGGAGSDSLSGGMGNDTLNGGNDNDTLKGGDGDDLVIGGLGVDYLSGGAGIDTVDFSGDYLSVNVDLAAGKATLGSGTAAFSETVTGFEHAVGGSGNDTLIGTAGDNLLRGMYGADSLAGGAGNDTLDGSDGTATYPYLSQDGVDTLAGGTGNDRYIVQWSAVSSKFDVVVEAADAGTDTVQLSFNNYTAASRSYQMTANVENAVVLTDSSYYNYGRGTLLGNGLNNVISVQSATASNYYYSQSVALYGGAGNDTLVGSAWDDILSGGTGNDSMSGGTGNDTYMVDASDDVVVEAAGGGTDTVVSSLATYTLGADIENLRLEEAPGALKGYGNDVGNVLTGNSLDNLLDGKGGADTLSGGAGNDTLNGGAGNDVIQGGSGDDVLDGGDNDTYSYSGYTGDTVSYEGATVNLKVDLSLTTVQATGAGSDKLLNFESLIGGLKNDALKGNSVANTILGGNGADTIWGGDGADVLKGGAGNDVLYGGAGIDQLTGGDGNDLFVFDARETLANPPYYSSSVDWVSDFTKGSDKIAISMAAFRIGDGDKLIESSPTAAQTAPGGFAAAAEVVVFTPANFYGGDPYSAATAIGSAASAYAVGDHRLFVVNQPSYYAGSTSTAWLYDFTSNAADASVTASELQLIGTVTLMPGAALPGGMGTTSSLALSDLSFVA